jgi:hypothetical protein
MGRCGRRKPAGRRGDGSARTLEPAPGAEVSAGVHCPVSVLQSAGRVPEPVRPIALAVPVASILVTLGLAYLLKMLAAASGAEAIHLAPPTPQPNRIVRSVDVLQGEIVRGPQAPEGDHVGTSPLDGQTSTWAPSQLAQTGQPLVVGVGVDQLEATKRRQVEAHLATLDPGQLTRLHQLGPRAAARELTGALHGQGVSVSER